MSLCDKFHYLRAEAQKRVVNIYPFLRARDQELKININKALDMIEKGFIPNSSDWSNATGTLGPIISPKPINGRYLFSKEELPDAEPAPVS